MTQVLIGAGGWAYFQVPGKDSLRAYSSSFNFVEVNSTYYEFPDARTVSGWRSRVPRTFKFSVRCHMGIADALCSGETKQIDSTMIRMREICRKLDADILTVLIPRGSRIGEANLVSGLQHTISTFSQKNTRIAVELREGATKKVINTLKENDAIHCVDISREQPAYESEVLYSRIFGKGQDNIYQFDDEEIREIAGKVSQPRFEKSILAFHGVRMFGDAARLKAFMKSGKFLKVSGQSGLDSLGEVLREDTTFPASKAELVNRQGWKLFDLTKDTRKRIGEYLSRLPDGNYKNLEEVISSLDAQFPPGAMSPKTIHAKNQRSS
jgi:uncharacterized protein YecE (DUF72 family)